MSNLLNAIYWVMLRISHIALTTLALMLPIVLIILTSVLVVVGGFSTNDSLWIVLTYLVPYLPVVVVIYYIIATISVALVGEGHESLWIALRPASKPWRLANLYMVGTVVVTLSFGLSLFLIALTEPEFFSPIIQIRPNDPWVAWCQITAFTVQFFSQGALFDLIEHFQIRLDRIVLAIMAGPNHQTVSVNAENSTWMLIYTFLFRTYAGIMGIRCLIWCAAALMRGRQF